MNKLSSNHIDHCTRRIAKWAKAIRLIHALELNLPETFPEPDSIVPGKNPFDLHITWAADNWKAGVNLRRRIEKLLGFENKWRICDTKPIYELRGKVRLGEKTTMNLRLFVTFKE
jgi:hypothetical protein